MNTWNSYFVCKLFALRIFNSSLQKIIISCLEYLKFCYMRIFETVQTAFKLFELDKSAWTHIIAWKNDE